MEWISWWVSERMGYAVFLLCWFVRYDFNSIFCSLVSLKVSWKTFWSSSFWIGMPVIWYSSVNWQSPCIRCFMIWQSNKYATLSCSMEKPAVSAQYAVKSLKLQFFSLAGKVFLETLFYLCIYLHVFGFTFVFFVWWSFLHEQGFLRGGGGICPPLVMVCPPCKSYLRKTVRH